jgi:hypoxanthine phosphoribosyltransferase
MVTTPEIKKVGDLSFTPYLEYTQILDRIQTLALQINADFEGKTPIFIPILNGAFMFAADLLKEIHIPCEVSFVKVASYHGTESSGEVGEVLGLQTEIENRHIILVEDIVDAGLTMSQVLRSFREKNPASISVAALFVKPDALQVQLPLNYVGFDIPNKFIVGYGLDYNGLGRNSKDVYQKADT